MKIKEECREYANFRLSYWDNNTNIGYYKIITRYFTYFSMTA